MTNCHNWWNRDNWHYPVIGWKIRICKICGQTQTQDREGYTNSSLQEFESMINWAYERDTGKRQDKADGLVWLKKHGVKY